MILDLSGSYMINCPEAQPKTLHQLFNQILRDVSDVEANQRPNNH